MSRLSAADNEDFIFVAGDESIDDESLIMPVPNPSTSITLNPPSQLPLTPAQTRPTTPTPAPPDPPPPRAITVEERASQLLHELTSLDTEKESLLTRLKSARKESQRADAALRSEIETLKKASERGAQMDQRSRQKILALQEATKQSLAASVDADAEVKLVETSIPAIEHRVEAVSREYKVVKEKVEKERLAAAESIKTDKKYVGDLEAELGGLRNRLERLNARKDKLVLETVPDLEQELGILGRKIEAAEMEQSAYLDDGVFDYRAMTMNNPLASPQDMARQNSLPLFSIGPGPGTISPPSRSPHNASALPAARIPVSSL